MSRINFGVMSSNFPSMLVAFGRPSDEQIRKTNELLGGPYEPPSS